LGVTIACALLLMRRNKETKKEVHYSLSWLDIYKNARAFELQKRIAGLPESETEQITQGGLSRTRRNSIAGLYGSDELQFDIDNM